MDKQKIIWLALGALAVVAACVFACTRSSSDVLHPNASNHPKAVMVYPDAESAARDIDHAEPAVREKAVLAYARRSVLEKPANQPLPLDKIQPLVRRLKSDANPAVRAAAAMGLGTTQSFEAVEPLGAALEDPDPLVQERAKRAIARITGVTLNFTGGGSDRKHRMALKYFHEVLMPEIKSGRGMP